MGAAGIPLLQARLADLIRYVEEMQSVVSARILKEGTHPPRVGGQAGLQEKLWDW